MSDTRITNEMQSLATKAHRLARELGDVIELLVERDCAVSATVAINGGSEGVELHLLTGEMELSINHCVTIDEEER